MIQYKATTHSDNTVYKTRRKAHVAVFFSEKKMAGGGEGTALLLFCPPFARKDDRRPGFFNLFFRPYEANIRGRGKTVHVVSKYIVQIAADPWIFHLKTTLALIFPSVFPSCQA